MERVHRTLSLSRLPGAPGRSTALLRVGRRADRCPARVRRCRLEDRTTRHLHRLDPRPARVPPHHVVNNARFLILPWVTSRHLASKLLGMAARRLPRDWLTRYSYRPVLLETFVEKQRFEGTCYKAANWINIGDTQGRGKLDRNNLCSLPVKSVWLLPLARRFREFLCAP